MARTSQIEREVKPWLDDSVAQSCTTDESPHFPNPFFRSQDEGSEDDRNADLPRTLLELRMSQLSAAIREKPQWQTKRLTLASKWREEILEGEKDVPEIARLTPAMVDYVLAELDSHVKRTRGSIEQGSFERIFRSDALVEESLRQRLIKAVLKLEDVPEAAQDWHPGSDRQVLDLVHPSLYPLRYKETIVHDNGEYKVLEPPEDEQSVFVSQKYAWLPSDFAIDAQGGAKLLSPYINNLKPGAHPELQSIIVELVGLAVPMWELVLTSLKQPLSHSRMTLSEQWDSDYHTKVSRQSCIWADEDIPYNEELAEAGDDEAMDAWIAEQPKKLPEPLQYSPDHLPAWDDKIISLKGSTLQVIVKLANIHLTPEKPDYPGGSWHVEGMRNDAIVSTFLYYYDEANITESALAFRCSVGMPTYHQQDDSVCTQVLYGLGRDDACVQGRGQVITKQGRALAFPNIYQHQVQPFSLADATKPGHRKIVALFLVDPTQRIPSATTVAPQQRDWLLDTLSTGKIASTFPTELLERVMTSTGTMTLEEAKAVRLDLMAERTATIEKDAEETIYVKPFSMCEH